MSIQTSWEIPEFTSADRFRKALFVLVAIVVLLLVLAVAGGMLNTSA